MPRVLVVIGLLALATPERAQTPFRPNAPQITFAAALSVALGLVLAGADVDPARLWGGNPFDDAAPDSAPDRSVGRGSAA